ncbi:MAG: metallophosphoesterase family protein [Elusimicrobia bacterium]|nr:metallophosphoesterase family protein [Elusimicrobiota bacterium]
MVVALAFVVLVGLVFYLEVSWLVRRFILKGRGGRFWPVRSPAVDRSLTVALHAVAALGGLCVLWGWVVEPRWIEIRTVTLESSKIKPETGRLRVAHLSDFHSEGRPLNELRAVEIVNSLEPDLVVFTGDFINSPEGLKVAREAFKGLKAAHGVFLVNGNYDVGLVPEGAFRGLPVVLLESGSRELDIRGTRVRVSGMSLQNGPDFRTIMGMLRKDPAYDIFLFHYSDLIGQAADLGVDLYLAGHTHGGQVRLPFYGALITLASTGKKYEAGLYRVGPTILYVNRGLGLEGGWAPRVRFLCRPEIAVIDIQPARP